RPAATLDVLGAADLDRASINTLKEVDHRSELRGGRVSVPLGPFRHRQAEECGLRDVGLAVDLVQPPRGFDRPLDVDDPDPFVRGPRRGTGGGRLVSFLPGHRHDSGRHDTSDPIGAKGNSVMPQFQSYTPVSPCQSWNIPEYSVESWNIPRYHTDVG